MGPYQPGRPCCDWQAPGVLDAVDPAWPHLMVAFWHEPRMTNSTPPSSCTWPVPSPPRLPSLHKLRAPHAHRGSVPAWRSLACRRSERTCSTSTPCSHATSQLRPIPTASVLLLCRPAGQQPGYPRRATPPFRAPHLHLSSSSVPPNNAKLVSPSATSTAAVGATPAAAPLGLASVGRMRTSHHQPNQQPRTSLGFRSPQQRSAARRFGQLRCYPRSQCSSRTSTWPAYESGTAPPPGRSLLHS